jgi:hypothetical protein
MLAVHLSVCLNQLPVNEALYGGHATVVNASQSCTAFISDDAIWYSAGLRAGRSGFQGSIPGGSGNFSLHHSVQNGSGTHPAS